MSEVRNEVMSETNEPELLPCPFCGGAAKFDKHEDHVFEQGFAFFAECKDCKNSTGLHALQECVANSWNRRV